MDDRAALAAQNQILRTQLALYRDAIEHMHQGLCMFDDDGRVVLCNDRYAEILQLPPGSVRVGMTGTEIIALGVAAGHYPGKTVADVRAAIHAQLAVADPALATMVRGENTYAVKRQSTPTQCLVTTCEDITAQISAEHAVRESEARLQAILDALPDCVKIFDQASRLVYINPRGLELLQAPDIASLSRPGYLAVCPEYLQECGEVHRRVLAGESVVWTFEVVGLQGRRRHVEAHAVPFRLPDGAPAHMCISRDVTGRKEAEDALRRSEARMRVIQDATGLAEFETEADGILAYSSRFFEQIGLSMRDGKLGFAEWLHMIHPDDRARIEEELERALRESDWYRTEFRVMRADTGEVRWLSTHAAIQRDEAGKAMRSIGAHLDITDRKRTEEALRESEERFRLAAEAAGLGVWDYDLTRERREWSHRLREIFGLPDDLEPSLEAAEACIHPGDWVKFMCTLEHARAAGLNRFESLVRVRRANDGAERWVVMNGWRTHKAESRLRRVIMTVRDVTEEKTAEERIRWSASHDALTGLANRSLFHEKLDDAIGIAAASGGSVGLVLLDMDHFKQINDTLGHDAGDMLLKMVAERLRGVVRATDTIARLGGDEFAVVLPDARCEQSLARLTRAIQERLREPFVHGGRILDCRASMGVSMYPTHGANSEALLKNADMALYAAKAAGRATVALYGPHMREEMRLRSSMVQQARDALRDGSIVPYYQPKLDLASGWVTGFEALLRWRTPRGRICAPGTLEAAFEDLDVAAALSDRIIEAVIADMRRWLDRDVAFGSVAINASAAEFRRDNFAERLLGQLTRADIPAHCLQLEVTETVFLGRGAEYVHRALALLNARGVKIALDDFGTGYASLRHLKQFPVDIIKIDRSFVRDMETDPGDEAIIRAVINLGRSLGITVVAEGIETEEQARRLIALGCHLGQGFLFSRAVPARRVPSIAGLALAETPSAPLRLVANRA